MVCVLRHMVVTRENRSNLKKIEDMALIFSEGAHSQVRGHEAPNVH